jgi:hypothetical protein
MVAHWGATVVRPRHCITLLVSRAILLRMKHDYSASLYSVSRYAAAMLVYHNVTVSGDVPESQPSDPNFGFPFATYGGTVWERKWLSPSFKVGILYRLLQNPVTIWSRSPLACVFERKSCNCPLEVAGGSYTWSLNSHYILLISIIKYD